MFFLVLFNYALSNGAAHLRNFSLFRVPQGDSILVPAYDLLDTAIHFPSEPSATALDFFADDHCTFAYETLGFHSSADFVELGSCFGVPESDVRAAIALFHSRHPAVERFVAASALSPEARSLFLQPPPCPSPMSVHSHPFVPLPLCFYSVFLFFFGDRSDLNEFAANRPILNENKNELLFLNVLATVLMELQAGGRI